MLMCKQVVANCSSLGLTHIPSPGEFDPLTSVLDLSNNSIEHVTRETFASGDFFYLSSLYLDNNIISTLEPFAFRNLASIRVISLRRNRITTIPTNGFSYLSGADSCGDDQGQGHQDEDEEEDLDDGIGCRIDLRQNDIAVVDKNAFAWTKQLSILLGDSEVNDTILLLLLLLQLFTFYSQIADNNHCCAKKIVSLKPPRVNLRASNFCSFRHL